MNYARVKFLSARSTIHFLFDSNELTDSDRVLARARIRDTLDELLLLGYVPAQIVMYQIYGGHRTFLRCSVQTANWLNKYRSSPTEASRLAAQLKQKGIVVQ